MFKYLDKNIWKINEYLVFCVMGKKKLLPEKLIDAEKTTLSEGWKNGRSPAFRKRCHCLLLSHQGYDAKCLSEMFAVSVSSVYGWLKNWKKYGISGITTKPGQGRKPKLCIDNEKHTAVVAKAVRDSVEKGTGILDQVTTELDIEGGVSKRTLRRFLRKKSTATSDYATSRKRSPAR